MRRNAGRIYEETYKGVKIYFEVNSYNAPSLGLYGYAHLENLRRAISRKLKKSGNRKNPASPEQLKYSIKKHGGNYIVLSYGNQVRACKYKSYAIRYILFLLNMQPRRPSEIAYWKKELAKTMKTAAGRKGMKLWESESIEEVRGNSGKKKKSKAGLKWSKMPSVTYGGKPYFWVARTPQGNVWVVWNRLKKAWVLEDWSERILKTFNTAEQGKKFANEYYSERRNPKVSRRAFGKPGDAVTRKARLRSKNPLTNTEVDSEIRRMDAGLRSADYSFKHKDPRGGRDMLHQVRGMIGTTRRHHHPKGADANHYAAQLAEIEKQIALTEEGKRKNPFTPNEAEWFLNQARTAYDNALRWYTQHNDYERALASNGQAMGMAKALVNYCVGGHMSEYKKKAKELLWEAEDFNAKLIKKPVVPIKTYDDITNKRRNRPAGAARPKSRAKGRFLKPPVKNKLGQLVVYRKGDSYIAWAGRPKRLMVVHEARGHCTTDYPILYKDGRVAWDRPEAIPQYLKDAAAKILMSK